MKNKIKNLLFDSNQGKIRLNDKASIFFFCLLLSIFFWFLSALSKNYTTTLSIPIHYLNSKHFIVMQSPIDAISIRVEGSGFQLLGEQMSLNRKPITISIERANKVKKNRFAILPATLKNELLNSLDKDLIFLGVQTDSIVLITEPRIEKEVRVKPNYDLSFEEGYYLRGVSVVYPHTVTISGPKSRVDTIEVLQLESEAITGVNDTIRSQIKLSDLSNYQGLQFQPLVVDVVIPVEKFMEETVTLSIEQQSEIKENNIRTFPQQAKASFLIPTTCYEKWNATDLVASVNISHKTLLQQKLKVKMKGVPNYAQLLKIKPDSVEYTTQE